MALRWWTACNGTMRGTPSADGVAWLRGRGGECRAVRASPVGATVIGGGGGGLKAGGSWGGGGAEFHLRGGGGCLRWVGACSNGGPSPWSCSNGGPFVGQPRNTSTGREVLEGGEGRGGGGLKVGGVGWDPPPPPRVPLGPPAEGGPTNFEA